MMLLAFIFEQPSYVVSNGRNFMKLKYILAIYCHGVTLPVKFCEDVNSFRTSYCPLITVIFNEFVRSEPSLSLL